MTGYETFLYFIKLVILTLFDMLESVRVSYSGNTPVFQTGVGGSIPPTRLSELKYPSSDGYFDLDQTALKGESKGISKRECLHVLKTRALEEREARI